MTRAMSVSPFAAELLAGPKRHGTAFSAGYARFGDDVIAITQPGRPRMPNGIEAPLTLVPGEPVIIGAGELRTKAVALTCGPIWDPRPSPRITLSVTPPPELDPEALAGRGPGLTPLGDDILVGYIAAASLGGKDASELAERAARRTTALSGTLIRLAAHGHLPEVVHRLLEDGDPKPILGFGHTSGKGIALGLALRGEARGWPGRVVALSFDRQRFMLEIRGAARCS
jgi:Protein of unknown function (DUF2877)